MLKISNYRLKMRKGKKYIVNYPILCGVDAVRCIIDNFYDLDREVFFTIQLDSANIPMNFSIQHIGSADCAIISPKEILKVALLVNAESLILMHNHPSGTLVFSNDDKNATVALIDGAKSVGLSIAEHYIFTPTKENVNLSGTSISFESSKNTFNITNTYTFEEVEVRQLISTIDTEKIVQTDDMIKHMYNFNLQKHEDMMVIFLDKKNNIREKKYYKINSTKLEDDTLHFEDIFRTTVLSNSGYVIVGIKDQLLELVFGKMNFFAKLVSRAKSLEIQVLDIYAVSDGCVQSLHFDYPELYRYL